MTAHVLWDWAADCSRLLVLRRQRSCLQNWCASVRWTRIAILNTTRCRTGRQCSRRSTGGVWSHRLVPVTSLAAAFWTDCRQPVSSSMITNLPGLSSLRRLPTSTKQPAEDVAVGNNRFDRLRRRGRTTTDGCQPPCPNHSSSSSGGGDGGGGDGGGGVNSEVFEL